MGTITDTSIVIDSARDLLKASRKMQIEVLHNDKYLNMLKQFGIINVEEKLSAAAGSKVTMYNSPRVDGLGVVGDQDMYQNATPLSSGDRTLQIRKHSMPLKYALDGSERQQISEFRLKDRAPKLITQWGSTMMLYQLLNQLGGNTATTMYAPGVTEFAATTAADRLILTGHNVAIAPSTEYHAWGSSAAGSISADEDVDADNVLTLADFMEAREKIVATLVGIPTWNRITQNVEGVNVDAIALVSTTGMNQLKNDPVTQGQGLNFAQFFYAEVAGGKKVPMPSNTYIYEGIAFVEVPDNLMPRGVHSGTAAAVANSRRAIIVGSNAVDYAFGKGYSFKGTTIAGFAIETDDQRDKLNKQGYLNASINAGCEKCVIFGTGDNTATAYDNATYIITHYSRS